MLHCMRLIALLRVTSFAKLSRTTLTPHILASHSFDDCYALECSRTVRCLSQKRGAKSKRKGLTRNRTGVARMSYTTEVMSIRTGSDNRYTIKPFLG